MDDQRSLGRDRPNHLSPGLSQQGQVGKNDPAEQRGPRGADRLSPDRAHAGPNVICSERSLATSPQAIVNMFHRWYRHLGFVGCSSHSGRRTFITNAARKISTVGGSLKDVQELAGHANLRTTQKYIDANPDAQDRVVGHLIDTAHDRI